MKTESGTKNSTEPVGFNGTPGDFHSVEYAGTVNIQDEPFYGGRDVLDAEDIGYEQMLANGKICAASKKMAVALQKWVDFTDKHIRDIEADVVSDFTEPIEEWQTAYNESRSILKEAGLNP